MLPCAAQVADQAPGAAERAGGQLQEAAGSAADAAKQGAGQASDAMQVCAPRLCHCSVLALVHITGSRLPLGDNIWLDLMPASAIVRTHSPRFALHSCLAARTPTT